MIDSQRGKIRNKDYVPTKDFSGIRFGKITPTDIDGFLDFGNKVFIFIELKYGASILSYGQRLALERLCDSCADAGKVSVVLVAHYENVKDEIDVGILPVSLIRNNKEWRKPKINLTVKQAIDQLLLWSKTTLRKVVN